MPQLLMAQFSQDLLMVKLPNHSMR